MASNSTNLTKFVSETTVSLIDTINKADNNTTSGGGISGGAVAGIVIAVVVALLLAGVVGFFAFKYVKDRRKNHGEYRPQFEEQHHAKDLPYLQPPNIEGLI